MEKIPLIQRDPTSTPRNPFSPYSQLSTLSGCLSGLWPRMNPQPDKWDDLIAAQDAHPAFLSMAKQKLPTARPVRQSTLTSGEKLKQLRTLMKQHGIAVYLVPSEDEHQSEETAEADKRREFLCGFTGSAGICVVTLDDPVTLKGEAALSTDGRYFLQAANQLDSKYWRLLKQGMAGYPTWTEFAISKARSSSVSNVISCDPKFVSLQIGEHFASSQSALGFTFKPLIDTNLVDVVWGAEKPQRSLLPVYELPIEFSGELAISKISRVRDSLRKLHASHCIISALDDIGWLLNLRSDIDIPFSPFFFAYAIVTAYDVTLYAKDYKLVNVKNVLKEIPGLTFKDYDDFYPDLLGLKATYECSDVRLVLPSKDSCNYALIDSIPHSVAKQTIIYDSIISVMKLTKNSTELFNARIAQSKDSLAFIMLAAWLDLKIAYRKEEVSEYDVAEKIYAIRSNLPNFKGLSYETIASSGPNAAIIHYAPTETQFSMIDPKNAPFLLDSGAHYLEGTTDITRTFKFGEEGLTEDYKKYYTLVLKGHLGVAVAKFPSNSRSTGTILDAYARQPLWNEGLDYNHGTGHGVGSFGNVHEGPLYILTTAGGVSTADYFKKGAILTDEPGYYIDGECGFRIESELEITEVGLDFGRSRGGGKYLGFNYLTKVPFCRKLIDKKYLSPRRSNGLMAITRVFVLNFGPKLLAMDEKKSLRMAHEGDCADLNYRDPMLTNIHELENTSKD